MKKVLVLLVLLSLAVAISQLHDPVENTVETASERKDSPTNVDNSNTSPVTQVSKAVFIPYWNIPSNSVELRRYDKLFYFGVAPDKTGILKKDEGIEQLSTFLSSTSSAKERLLTVRMLDTSINTAILQDKETQAILIDETIDLIQSHELQGVVLDLELSVLPFSGTAGDITTFVSEFARQVHAVDKKFMITIYGDTYYRGRPYDIQALNTVVDGMIIMAYDFHKSRGEPGPNFPFERRSLGGGATSYPYSFQDMIQDFTHDIPTEKLTVAFGMYGYDWILGPQGLPLKGAKAIPLYQIEAGYGECDVIQSRENAEPRDPSTSVGMTKCELIVNQISKEKVIHYLDDDGYKHELWYEDEESVAVKIEFLKEQGIGSVGYWVWGYY